jgi:hypothetical protein
LRIELNALAISTLQESLHEHFAAGD